jgi:hypothetical protein
LSLRLEAPQLPRPLPSKALLLALLLPLEALQLPLGALLLVSASLLLVRVLVWLRTLLPAAAAPAPCPDQKPHLLAAAACHSRHAPPIQVRLGPQLQLR